MVRFITTLISCLVGLALSACTTGPLYGFVVYASSAPKPVAAFVRPTLAELSAPFVSRGIGSPTSIKVSIYSFYLATTADCATPIPLIDYGGNPLTKEFYSSPTLFSGNPGAFSYQCAVIKISDSMRFKPDAASVAASLACASVDTEYGFDGYLSAQSDAGTWRALSGDLVPATGAVADPSLDIVTLFASTDPPQAIAHRNLAPNQVIPLSAAIQVPGDVTLYTNYLGAVVDSSGTCTLSGGLILGLN